MKVTVTPKLKRTSVVLSFKIENKLREIYTGVTTSSEKWSKAKKYIKGEGKLVLEKNEKIDELKKEIESYLRKLKSKGQEYFHGDLLNHLKSLKKNQNIKNNKTDLIHYFDLYIDQKTSKFSIQTIKAYRTTKNHFYHYLNTLNKKSIKFQSINHSILNEFVDHLRINLNLSPAARGKHIKNLKAIMNQSLNDGLHDNSSFQSFKKEKEDSAHVYLSHAELNLLNQFRDYTESERFIIDVFLFICWTGVRFGDYFNLNEKNFINKREKNEKMKKSKEIWYLHFIQEKTSEEVLTPILYKEAISVIKKYQNNLPKFSNAYINRSIKIILNKYDLINQSIQVKKEKLKGEYLKRELISIHTGRRSFCTNQYLEGTPTQFIMAASGHETESSFRKYIKADQLDKSKELINYVNY